MLGPAADQAQVAVFPEANSSGGVTESGSNILKSSASRSSVESAGHDDPAANLIYCQCSPSVRWARRFVGVDRHFPCKALAAGSFSYSGSSSVVECIVLVIFGVALLASNPKKRFFS